MKEIQLTQGKVALVDDADFDWLNQWKWYANTNKTAHSFYAIRTNKNNNKIKMHRLIMGLTDPKVLVDHIDCNGLNNQRSNLRTCTNIQNQYNKSVAKSIGLSKYKGVSQSYGRWCAQIRADGKHHYLGLFDNETDAAIAYNKKAMELHGEFARLNIIE